MKCKTCKQRTARRNEGTCRVCCEAANGPMKTVGRRTNAAYQAAQVAAWCDECTASGFHRDDCPVGGIDLQSFRRNP